MTGGGDDAGNRGRTADRRSSNSSIAYGWASCPKPPAATNPAIVIPAEVMGLRTMRTHGPSEFGPYGDDVNALDVVPEPSTVLLSAFGGLCLLAYAWRRRRKV